jgi:CyaY protein
MTESEFNQRADAVLRQIEDAVDSSGADIEYETNTGILELTFENGSKIIVNRQSAAREIWVAAKSGGYHFTWTDGAWRDTRDGTELFEALSRYASQQAGEAVLLRPDL